MSSQSRSLSTQEFAFRYLNPQEEIAKYRPFDELERAYQYTSATLNDDSEFDFSSILRQVVIGSVPRGTVLERSLASLLQVHMPTTVTPFSDGTKHASYPSPRAYYPLKFILIECARHSAWFVDMQKMRLRSVDYLDYVKGHDEAGLAIYVKNDFHVYAPFYNLFRQSLFALEVGHFCSELIAVNDILGLETDVDINSSYCRMQIREKNNRKGSAASFIAHQSFSRNRNSGYARQGFFPKPSDFNHLILSKLLQALRDAIQMAAAYIGCSSKINISVKLCLRAGYNIDEGVYILEPAALRQVTSGDPVDTCERFFGYKNFSFRFVPAVVFLCVDELAFHCSDDELLKLNLALGFISQEVIRQLYSIQLIGRPFRSYEQSGIDSLLHNNQHGLRAYYGLIIAKNRYEEAVGVLR